MSQGKQMCPPRTSVSSLHLSCVRRFNNDVPKQRCLVHLWLEVAWVWGPVHTMLEKNDIFTLKTHQNNVFRLHYARKIWKHNNHWSFLGMEIAWLSWLHRCQDPFSKCSPSTGKCEAGIFKFLQFEEHFRKSSVFITDLCGWFPGRWKETTNHTYRIPVKWHHQLKMAIWLRQLHSRVSLLCLFSCWGEVPGSKLRFRQL